jgi:hypothetical protein
MKIKLTKEQFEYLKYNLPETLTSLTNKVKDFNLSLTLLEVDNSVVDEDWAGERLQKVGFDGDYSLTKEGKILEELIDLFYFR